MQEGILNEPVRESADQLLRTFGEQLRIPFSNVIFIAIAPDGNFRSANYGKEFPLTKEAIRMVAKHLESWADGMAE